MDGNYQVIADEAALREYIEWLPTLSNDEIFYLCLFGRKKYCPELPHIKTDKSQLKRFTSDKDLMLRKIRQLECPLGSYTQKEHEIPQHALALYITPNPRDMKKATLNAVIDLAVILKCDGKADSKQRHSNPHQEVMSTIQRTPGKKHVTMFDIDSKEPAIYDDIVRIAGPHCDIVETRGGYHVFVRASEMDNKVRYTYSDKELHWYAAIYQYADRKSKADLSPVVGCFQGGFVPKFVHRTHPIFNKEHV